MAHSIADDYTNPPQQHTVLLATDNKNSVFAEVVVGRTNRMAYSAYGHQSAQQEVMTRLGFNGELREMQTSWYLLGNGYRAYNPRLMRFHSPDNLSPFGAGGLNAYMYCGGEPVMNSDPTGHSVWALFKAQQLLTGVVAEAVTQVISKTASTISNGMSQVSRAAQSAKKAFANTFLFDPEVLKKLGPPPPKAVQNKPSNHVFYPNRYPRRYNEVRRQQAKTVSGSNSGNQLRHSANTSRPISNTPGTSSSFNPRGHGAEAVNRSEPFNHVGDTRASDRYTVVLDMNGTIRSGMYLEQ
jgi:RHS repeat-associated protein